MLNSTDLLFYVLGLATFAGALGVILARNPIYSALNLVVTMIGVAGLFATLDALFIAAVQLIVYAGAVMILFVMVLMLFDLKHELKTFSKGLIGNGLKLASAGVILGMLTVYIWYTFSAEGSFKPLSKDPAAAIVSTKHLATVLFTDYIFAFEALGALLLVIAIGAVTLSRIAGGTHHAD